jgi:hypothetical protein
VGVSIATPAPSDEKVAGLTLQTTGPKTGEEVEVPEPVPAFGINLGASVVLASVIGVLWIVFR